MPTRRRSQPSDLPTPRLTRRVVLGCFAAGFLAGALPVALVTGPPVLQMLSVSAKLMLPIATAFAGGVGAVILSDPQPARPRGWASVRVPLWIAVGLTCGGTAHAMLLLMSSASTPGVMASGLGIGLTLLVITARGAIWWVALLLPAFLGSWLGVRMLAARKAGSVPRARRPRRTSEGEPGSDPG